MSSQEKLKNKSMLKTFKGYVSRLLMAMTLLMCQPVTVLADTDWITQGFSNLFTSLFNECMEIPKFNNFTTGNVVMDLGQSGKWISAGRAVSAGKMLKIQWNTQGAQAQPRKYMIMYRIDPRFTIPQLFIVQYNYTTSRYDSDFHQFNNGKLAQYQAFPEMDFSTRASAYQDYFNFRGGRSKIQIDQGDVINITLVSMGDLTALAAKGSGFSSELDTNPSNLASVFTKTGLRDNGILYSTSQTWCNYITQNPGNFPNATCTEDPSNGEDLFAGPQNSYNRFIGVMDFVKDGGIMPLNNCPSTASGGKSNPPCIYDRGRGMQIFVAGKEVKSTYTPFIHSDFTNEDFFYYKSEVRGNLDFNTTLPMNNMFRAFPQDIGAWNGNYGTTVASVGAYLTSNDGYVAGMSKFLHLGRYIMMVNIGSSDNAGSFMQQDDIKLEYQVLPPGSEAPSEGASGISVTSQEYNANASSSGNLWLKVTNPHNEVGGRITVSYSYYTGSTFLSDILYNSVALPVMEMMRGTAALFYSGIATNPQWQLTVRILLSLYIIIYGLSFLAGKIQVTAIDVITRVIKLAVVFAMFSENSWTFFNQNVFNLFLGGMSYLASNVVGVTSSVGNLFGFVDVIFDKYTNPTVWKILVVELLQIQNGMTYLALLMIEAIFSYLCAVVEVVVCYIMAFLTMCVLISLAPIFLVCMLFERTRGMFDNWMSLIFNYMIQPTVLLIFFLLIDKLMTNQFSEAVMQACWNWLVTINIDIDMNSIGLDFRIKFTLPFIPGIPFYTAALVLMNVACPFVSSGGELTTIAGAVLMFKIYAQLSAGLIEYVTNIVASITNVAPGRKSGVAQSASNPTQAVANQLKAPFKAVGDKVGSGAKDLGSKIKEGYKNPKRSSPKEDKKD